MSFGTLALIGICGLSGPLLAAAGRGAVPVVAGEILAGVVIGRTGINLLSTDNATLAFLSDVGFTMLMFSAGMNVPVREPAVRAALPVGAARAVAVAAMGVGAALFIVEVHGVAHPAVYAVVIGSGSAAVVLPIVQERRLRGQQVLAVIAQVTVADIGATLAIPFVLRPGHAGEALVGTALVAVALVALYAVVRRLRSWERLAAFRRQSKRRRWAIDLRVALIVLFGLAWIARRTGASLLIAGFGAGLMVAAIGGPKRLSTEVLGVAGGFFVPLFFVVLGARLDLRGLFVHPELLTLAFALVVSTLVVHLLVGAATRQRPAAALLGCAQLGVPAAVVALGLSDHVLSPGEAAAIIAAALITLGASAIGAELLARHPDGPQADSRAHPEAARPS